MNQRRRALQAQRARRNRTIFVAVIGALVVAGAAVIALVAGGGNGTEDADGHLVEETANPVVVEGTALPEFAGEADPAVGQPFPTLRGTGLDGQPLVIGDSGEPTVVVYLAHWCPHCQAEVPVLVDHIAGGGVPDGVRVVAVSTGIDPQRPNYPPSAWLEEEGWQQPTLVDPDGAAAAAGGLPGFPYFVAVDGDGNVTARITGELTPDQFNALAATATPPA